MGKDYEDDIDDFDDVDDDDDDSMTDTVVMNDSDDTDNVGDSSVEINVEQLIADIEKERECASARKMEIRRRLEELAEAKSLEDTYAFDFDDE